MTSRFDVFVSHARTDGDHPRLIAEALADIGLRVWFDAFEIDDFSSITRAIQDGLMQSKALLAYYSKTYPLRRACQWELTTAFLAAQTAGDPRRRILLINPEKNADHIHPIELRDAKFRTPPSAVGSELPELVQSVAQHLASIQGPMADIYPNAAPLWHGTKPIGSTRFVGRPGEMWRIHTLLHASDVAPITGVPAGTSIGQVTGLGGVGKSLLAEEYALRFGALVWVAEQLDLIGLIDRACGQKGPEDGPTIGEMVVAVAVQRACAPGAKCHLAAFLESCLPRVSCLPAEAFTGQAFHRLAADVTDEQLEKAQIGIARAAVERFGLSTDVLAFDTTNFDTHIATTTAGDLARRGHAKSKRSDLRVVGLAILVSETGHVPLLHRTYPGNGSDQAVLGSCLDGLGKLHDALDQAEQRTRPACRTLVRDGGSWSEQLELDLDVASYYTLKDIHFFHLAI